MSIMIGKTATECAIDFIRDMAASDPWLEENRNFEVKCRYCGEDKTAVPLDHKVLCPWKRAQKITFNLKLEGIP